MIIISEKHEKLLKRVNKSIALKKKHGWKRGMGSGFIKEDIHDYRSLPDGRVRLQLFDKNPRYAHFQSFNLKDFNLPETEQLRDYLKTKIKKRR